MNSKIKIGVCNVPFCSLTDIPLFGLLTKEDLVDWEDTDILNREREFLQSLGIDETTSYSRWHNSSSGDFSCKVLYFLDKLMSPEVRVVLDQIGILHRCVGALWEHPSSIFTIMLVSCFGCACIFYVYSFGLNLSFLPL